jgi:hypothetical protein
MAKQKPKAAAKKAVLVKKETSKRPLRKANPARKANTPKMAKIQKSANKPKTPIPRKSANRPKALEPRKGTGKPKTSRPRRKAGTTENVKTRKPEVRSMGGKSKKGASPARARLEKELKERTAKIDDQGLIFLLKQAQVILHNMQVDKINTEIDKFESSKKKGKFEKEVKEVARASAEVKPSSDGKSFIIVMNNARKIFNLPEMRKIVGICEIARSDVDASARLYSWFHQNRRDVLGDAGIGNPRNPVLSVLYKIIKSKYKTKK